VRASVLERQGGVARHPAHRDLHLAQLLRLLVPSRAGAPIFGRKSAAICRLHGGDRARRKSCEPGPHERLSESLPDVLDRIIFVTGGAFTPRGVAFLDRVPNPRLEKPLDLHNLRAMIQSVMR
jgi:hypothetical protein